MKIHKTSRLARAVFVYQVKVGNDEYHLVSLAALLLVCGEDVQKKLELMFKTDRIWTLILERIRAYHQHNKRSTECDNEEGQLSTEYEKEEEEKLCRVDKCTEYRE